MIRFVGFIELGLIHMSMLQEPLMVAIRYGGVNGVSVGGLIFVDNKSSGDKPYCFNVVVF